MHNEHELKKAQSPTYSDSINSYFFSSRVELSIINDVVGVCFLRVTTDKKKILNSVTNKNEFYNKTTTTVKYIIYYSITFDNYLRIFFKTQVHQSLLIITQAVNLSSA